MQFLGSLVWLSIEPKGERPGDSLPRWIVERYSNAIIKGSVHDSSTVQAHPEPRPLFASVCYVVITPRRK